MTPFAIIERATADGVSIALAASGKLKACGPRDAVDKWLPAMRAHKPAIIAALKTEAIAYECCVSEWLNQNSVRSEPGRCLQCGMSGASGPVVPFGTTTAGHAWLHSGCWPDWFADRKAQARAALAALGIVAPISAKRGQDAYH